MITVLYIINVIIIIIIILLLLKFSGTNQKSERRWPFGTGLVRHCPQGLFSPFFTFLRAIFFRPFRLSFAPTICPWVSEDEWLLTVCGGVPWRELTIMGCLPRTGLHKSAFWKIINCMQFTSYLDHVLPCFL